MVTKLWIDLFVEIVSDIHHKDEALADLIKKHKLDPNEPFTWAIHQGILMRERELELKQLLLLGDFIQKKS